MVNDDDLVSRRQMPLEEGCRFPEAG